MESERLVVQLRDSVRLDRFLTRRLARVSRTRVQRHIERGDVLVNGRRVRPSHRLSDGDVVTIPGLEDRSLDAASRPVPFWIVHEDAHLVVVDKPAGVLVHPVGAEYQRTLLNGLHWLLRQRGESAAELGIVHRLDRLTSGLIVLAKSLDVRRQLSRAVEARQVYRAYLAVVQGEPAGLTGRIDLPIARDPARPTRMLAMPEAAAREFWVRPAHVSSCGYSDAHRDLRPRPACTCYRVVRRLRGATLVRFVLETGRTHQIRVHAQAAGFPVWGDPLYNAGSTTPGAGRMALHASRLEFRHPMSGQLLRLQAPLPAELRALVESLALSSPPPARAPQGGVESVDAGSLSVNTELRSSRQ